MSDDRTSWDETLFAMCRLLADCRADCRRARHAAIVFDETTREVISMGYNGLAAGAGSCLAGDCPRGSVSPEEIPHLAPYDSGPGQCDAVHAEVNAIIRAGLNQTRGRTLYVTGEPCHGCRVIIEGSGIGRVAVGW